MVAHTIWSMLATYVKQFSVDTVWSARTAFPWLISPRAPLHYTASVAHSIDNPMIDFSIDTVACALRTTPRCLKRGKNTCKNKIFTISPTWVMILLVGIGSSGTVARAQSGDEWFTDSSQSRYFYALWGSEAEQPAWMVRFCCMLICALAVVQLFVGVRVRFPMTGNVSFCSRAYTHTPFCSLPCTKTVWQRKCMCLFTCVPAMGGGEQRAAGIHIKSVLIIQLMHY